MSRSASRGSPLIPHLVAIARVIEIYGKEQVQQLQSLAKILARMDRRISQALAAGGKSRR